MIATLAWLPLSPLRPCAMSAKRKGGRSVAAGSISRDVSPFIESPAVESNLWLDHVLADQGGPVGKHLAHRRPSGRIARDPGSARSHKRRKFLRKPIDDGATAVPD